MKVNVVNISNDILMILSCFPMVPSICVDLIRLHMSKQPVNMAVYINMVKIGNKDEIRKKDQRIGKM